jgi:hypothetical protein
LQNYTVGVCTALIPAIADGDRMIQQSSVMIDILRHVSLKVKNKLSKELRVAEEVIYVFTVPSSYSVTDREFFTRHARDLFGSFTQVRLWRYSAWAAHAGKSRKWLGGS